MSRLSGVVVECSGSKPLIVTTEGLVSYEPNRENHNFRVGDYVSFTASQTVVGAPSAVDLEPCAPFIETKIHNEDFLLKCEVMKGFAIHQNQRFFRTNFIRNIQEGTHLHEVSINAFIGKTVYIKYMSNSQTMRIVEIEEPREKTITVIGLAYLETFNPQTARVYVPGYPEDFIIPGTPKLKTKHMLDSWVQFSILTETAQLDPNSSIFIVNDQIDSSCGGLIMLECEKVGNNFRTIYGDSICDPHNELVGRGIRDDFKNKLWIKLRKSHSHKPIFELHEHQPFLPKRKYPRASVQPERPAQQERYIHPREHSRQKASGNKNSNFHGNSSNSRIGMQTSISGYQHIRTERPRLNQPAPDFSGLTTNQDLSHTTPPIQSQSEIRLYCPPYEDAHRAQISENFSCERSFPPFSSNQSVNCFSRSTPAIQNYNQYNNALMFNEPHETFDRRSRQDKEMADLVRYFRNNSKFNAIIEKQFPEFSRKLNCIFNAM